MKDIIGIIVFTLFLPQAFAQLDYAGTPASRKAPSTASDGIALTPKQAAIALKGHHKNFCAGGLEFLTDYEDEFFGSEGNGDAKNLRKSYEKRCQDSTSEKSLTDAISDANIRCRSLCWQIKKQAFVKNGSNFEVQDCISECGDFAFEARTELGTYLQASRDMIQTDCGKLSPSAASAGKIKTGSQ